MLRTPNLQYRMSTDASHYTGPKVISNGRKRFLFWVIRPPRQRKKYLVVPGKRQSYVPYSYIRILYYRTVDG